MQWAAGVHPIRSAGGNLFENLGFAYLGPVDGHDIRAAVLARLPEPGTSRTCRQGWPA